MVSTLIGRTPEGWTETQLADICELTPGAATSDDPRGEVPVVKPKNLIAGRISGPIDHVTEEIKSRSRYEIRNGDLLCVRTGTIGRFALTTAEQAGWLFGTGLIRVRPAGQIDPLYLSFYFAHPEVQIWFSHNATGTAIQSINTRVLGSLPVAFPSLSTQQAIGHTLNALNEKIAAHNQICQTVAELRDALLPLLYSGKVSASLESEGFSGQMAVRPPSAARMAPVT